MKLLVLINLSSGTADGSTYDFVRSFAHAGDTVVMRYVDMHSDFSEALSDAKTFDRVVAVGGDGTVATVCYLLRDTGVPVLPFPAGTANLLTQNIYSPTESPALAQLLRRGHVLDFDMGELEYPDGTKRGFSMMAGCGYDATIMNDAARNKKLLGPLAYFTAAFHNPNPQVSRFFLEIDGTSVRCEGVGVVFVNFSKIQGDISLALSNAPRDGLLDVIVLATDTAWNLLPPFVGASIDRSGRPLVESDALSYYRGRAIRVVADPPLYCQYDGEPLHLTTPFTARALPSSVKLVVGDEAYREFGNGAR